MLILQNLGYTHSNKDVLFENLHLSIKRQDKAALIGNNGVGKSTLLQLIAGKLRPTEGMLKTQSEPYYVPQIFGQFNHLTIAQALQIEGKLNALKAITEGEVTEENLTLLNDDWDIEERCQSALQSWGLSDVDVQQKMETLSGGQKTKVFLAGIAIHQPELILLDEPSNHLDAAARQVLYELIQSSTATFIIVSHDRILLNLLDTVYELSKRGISTYGGNYDFYQEQKRIENQALNEDIYSKEKALRKAKEVERESIERQQKLDARGKKKQLKAGVPTIMMNTLRNNAEKSTSRIKDVHAEKVGSIAQELSDLRKEVPDIDKMKFGFDQSNLHRGKVLFTAKGLNHQYQAQTLWRQALDLQILSGERIALRGQNGSGKTTLIKILLGKLEPTQGTITRADLQALYIDQDYSLIDNSLSVYEQAQAFNSSALQEHDIKIRLSRFLFKDQWDKPCSALSGGEKMRLMLCCLNISNQAPDLIVLDEPTNNLDIQNVEILTMAINDYQGTLIVVSHDQRFLEEIRVERMLELDLD